MKRDKFIQGLESDIQLSEDERKYIIQKGIILHPTTVKCIVVMEELAELQQQISKQVREEGDYIGLLEEMADVYICLRYLESIFHVNSDDIQKAIDVKLERENNRWSLIDEKKFGKFDNNTLAKLEDVFGFRFFVWQRAYLRGDNSALRIVVGRRRGKTFIYCLRLLLENREPFSVQDFKGPQATMYTDMPHLGRPYIDHFLGDLCDINKKLVEAGFKTNLIM